MVRHRPGRPAVGPTPAGEPARGRERDGSAGGHRAARPAPAQAAAPARGAPWALAALTVLLAWTYARLLAGEPHGLDTSAHLVEVTHLARAIRAGDWNWWNPAGNSGFASGYYY